MLMAIKIENIAPMNAISRIGLVMNKEFIFYTSYLFFKRLYDEKIITKQEFKNITSQLMEKYRATKVPFILHIT